MVILIRKRHFHVLLVYLFLLGCTGAMVLFGQQENLTVMSEIHTITTPVFVIDAGHGGEDPGAIGISGVYEKDLNLEISYLIGAALAERGYAVIYTRSNDKLLYSDEENIKGLRKISDLKNRCKIAAEYPNSTFISIHMNSFSQSKYSGLQVYYSKNNQLSYQLFQGSKSV